MIYFFISDPCDGKDVCGPNAICSCTNHAVTCTCPLGFHGNPTPEQGCVRVPSTCQTPQDCPSQHVCVSGLCQCQCSEQNNCAQGERCKNGICVKICYSDSNCLPGELCIDGTCEAGCTSDIGCKRDEVCINNKCRYPFFYPKYYLIKYMLLICYILKINLFLCVGLVKYLI